MALEVAEFAVSILAILGAAVAFVYFATCATGCRTRPDEERPDLSVGAPRDASSPPAADGSAAPDLVRGCPSGPDDPCCPGFIPGCAPPLACFCPGPGGWTDAGDTTCLCRITDGGTP